SETAVCEESTLFNSISDSDAFIPYDERIHPLVIKLENGKQNCDPIKIKKIKSNSHYFNILKEKDYILSVNDIPLYFMDYEKVIDIIEACKPELNFGFNSKDIRRRLNFGDFIRTDFFIELKGTNYNAGIVLSNIISWNEIHDLQQKGDIIASINGQIISPKNVQLIKSQIFNPVNLLFIDIIIYRSKDSILPGNLLYFYNSIFLQKNEDFLDDSLVKIYKISKKNNKFGINVVGGCHNYPLMVVGTENNSAASSINIYTGDQILKLNDLEASLLCQSEFVDLIKNMHEIVLVTISNISGLKNFYSYIQYLSMGRLSNLSSGESSPNISLESYNGFLVEQKSEFIVRALYSFDAALEKHLPGKAISFNFGDILHILNGSSKEWWRAEKLDSNGDRFDPPIVGIVPSDQMYYLVISLLRMVLRKRKFEKKVHFDKPLAIFSRKSSLDSNKSRVNGLKSSRVLNRSCVDDINRFFDKKTTFDMKSYEFVFKVPYDQPRPLIIFGFYREKLIRHLITEFPSKFSICATHVSKHYNYSDADLIFKKVYIGVENMVLNFNKKQYVDFIFKNGDYNGICLEEISKIINNNKHCILNVSQNSIKKLNDNKIYPIVVLLKKPRSQNYLNNDKFDWEQKFKINRNAEILEKYYSNILTDVIEVKCFEDALNSVLYIVNVRQSDFIWNSNRNVYPS
ncbi:hypothetical protein MXB_4440, partial [Myxobolus squamalis]